MTLTMQCWRLVTVWWTDRHTGWSRTPGPRTGVTTAMCWCHRRTTTVESPQTQPLWLFRHSNSNFRILYTLCQSHVCYIVRNASEHLRCFQIIILRLINRNLGKRTLREWIGTTSVWFLSSDIWLSVICKYLLRVGKII